MIKKKALKIIRLGTSGSMQADIPVGSLLASEVGIGMDTLMQFYPSLSEDQYIAELIRKELGLGFLPYQTSASSALLSRLDERFLRGITLTCPGFYAPQGREVRLKPRFEDMISRLSSIESKGKRLTNFEMETAGYYAMGKLLGHEVLSLNAIVANRPKNEFDKKRCKNRGYVDPRSLRIIRCLKSDHPYARYLRERLDFSN